MEQIVLNLNLKYVIAGLTAEQKGLLLEALFEGVEKIARAGGESGLETGGGSAARAGGESAADMPLPAVLQNQPEAGNAYRFILLQQYEYEAKRRRMRQLGARGAARRKGNAAAKMADLFAAEAEGSARSGGSAGAATMVIGCGSERAMVKGADVNDLPGAGSSAGAGASLIEAVAGAAVAENNGAETCRATGRTAVVTGVGATVGADAGAAVTADAGAAVTAGGSSGVQAALTLKRKEAKENILNKNNILFLGLTEKKKEPAAGLELAADDGAAKATGLGLAADDGTAGLSDKGGYGAAGASGVPDGSGGGSCGTVGSGGGSCGAAGSGGGSCGTVGSGGGSCGAVGSGGGSCGTVGSGGGSCGMVGSGGGSCGTVGSGGGSCGMVGSGGGSCGAAGSGGDNPGGRLAFFSGRKRRGVHASPVLPQPAFQPPSVAEVQAFVVAENLQLDAGTFVDFYDSHGWCVGKTAIKNWKATARLWHRRAVAEAATRGGKKSEDDDGYWAELENKISRL